LFKSILLLGVLIFGVSLSFGKPTYRKGSEKNFQRCIAHDSSWMERWGKWIVSYDLYEAADICRAKAWPSNKVNARQTGCYINWKWYTAGYYCDPY
jgi:hypothetical protein